MKTTNSIKYSKKDYRIGQSVEKLNAWKPTLYYICGIIMLIGFIAVIGYMIYCAIKAS